MRLRNAVLVAVAVVFALSIGLFFLYKDPMILIFGVMLAAVVAGIVALVGGRSKPHSPSE